MGTIDPRDRCHKILEAIILSYAESANPVGSEFLLGRYPFGVSSATIRNVMAELEGQGLVTHPHTSAGRIPTDRGYRYYVDLLMQGVRVRPDEEETIDTLRSIRWDQPEQILEEAARTLADLTHEAGVVLVPQVGHGSFRRIELIAVRPGELVGVLICSEGIVRHARVALRQPLAQEELLQLEDLLNGELAGLSLGEAYLQLRTAAADWFRGATQALEAVDLEPLFQEEGDVILEGTSWILEAPEFQDMERTRRLLKGLEDQRELAEILRRDLSAEGVKVHIGSENRGTSLTDCAIVAAPYRLGAGVTGTIGVVGPTRLNYPRVASLVGQSAQTVTRLFQQRNSA